MKSKVNIYIDDVKYSPKITQFPTGEIAVKVKGLPDKCDSVKIVTGGYDKDLLLVISSVKNILDDKYGNKPTVQLKLSYLPNARYDRSMVEGDSFMLQVFSDMINLMNFDSVTLLDPHSDVATKTIKHIFVISQYDIVSGFEQMFTPVCPDKGAKVKFKLFPDIEKQNPIYMDKVRDPVTGSLSGFSIVSGNPKGEYCLIIDDICDGGGTFIGQAKVLKESGAKSVGLFVTHGIFSKGIDILLENGIDFIITTNSYQDIEPSSKVDVLDIFDWKE